jgi:hypothetical protein
MCYHSLFGAIRDKAHVGSYIPPGHLFNLLSHVEKYGPRRYGSKPKAAGWSHPRQTLDDEAMLQSYPESPVSPSSQGAVPGSTAETALVSNSAAEAQSNATNLSPPPPPATRKSRVALACKRCKRRKQRVRHFGDYLMQESWLRML